MPVEVRRSPDTRYSRALSGGPSGRPEFVRLAVSELLGLPCHPLAPRLTGTHFGSFSCRQIFKTAHVSVLLSYNIALVESGCTKTELEVT